MKTTKLTAKRGVRYVKSDKYYPAHIVNMGMKADLIFSNKTKCYVFKDRNIKGVNGGLIFDNRFNRFNIELLRLNIEIRNKGYGVWLVAEQTNITLHTISVNFPKKSNENNNNIDFNF